MDDLKLLLFGAPCLERHGQPLPLRRSKAWALLAYLAVSRRPHARESLLGLLWPEFDAASARNNLRRELSLLRSLLGGQALISQDQQVGWNAQAALWCDVGLFQAYLAEADRLPATSAQRAKLLTAAVELARAPFLAGLGLPECPAFEEWQLLQGEVLGQQLATALSALVAWQCEQGAAHEAIGYARRWVALDPLHEPAQRALIRCYALAGQHSAALRQYDACARLLDAELGIEPDGETRTLYEAVKARRVVRPHAPAVTTPADLERGQPAMPAAAPKQPPGPQLRLQPASLIGREQEVADLRRLILEEPSCRLVTLLGPGGTGKTKLAQAVATALGDMFPQGAVFVPLASVSRPAFVATAIANAMHLTLAAGADPTLQLVAALRDQRLLLVLDNVEQLIPHDDHAGAAEEPSADGTALLAELLRGAPGVVVLVTSRERLNLHEEWCYEVQGMPYPTGERIFAGLTAAQLVARYSAVRLFVERARRAKASYTPTPQDLPHIVRICQLVGGMPLGLELAASWVRALTCQEIADEIAGSLDFLTSPIRDLPERHRSLRGVFEQSWRRLTATEQRVLSTLAVFAGGCTWQAAEAVAGASQAVLATLIDRALLRRSADGRLVLHELVLQYAAGHLQQTRGEAEAAQAHHARYYAALLQRWAAALKGARQLEAIAAIAAELSNVRAAWRWALDHGDLALIGQAQESLYYFYEMQGQAQEGAQAFASAVAVVRMALPPEAGSGAAEHRLLLGQVLVRQGFLTNRLGLIAPSVELMQEGVAYLRQVGAAASAELAQALHFLGGEVYFQGEYAAARRLLWEGLELAQSTGDAWLIGLSWQGLGQTAEFQGEYAEAVPCFQQSIAAYRQAGEQRWQAYALNNWGRAAYAMGAYAQAKTLLSEALEIRQRFGDLTGMGYSLLDLGKLATLQGQYAQARDYIEQSLALCEEIGDRDQVARCLGGLGAVLRLCGEPERAAHCYQASLDAYTQMGIKAGLPAALAGLGQLAYDQADYAVAWQRFQESWRLSEELGHPGATASAARFLGHLAVADGRAAEARSSYRVALELVLKTGAAPIALDVLLGWATLLSVGERSGPTEAQALAALVAQHPAAPHELSARAQAQLRAFVASRPAEQGSAEQAMRPNHDWQGAARALLERSAYEWCSARASNTK